MAGKPYKKVIVLETPVTERYCNIGDTASLDDINNQIRCGGVWFEFNEKWKVKPKS